MKLKQIEFESNFFRLFELREGIYAALGKEEHGISVSMGIFDLGNYLIIYDTNIYPGAGEDLYRAAKQITGKEPTFIINSHYHSDHIMGNSIFSTTIPIISSYATLEKIKEVSFNRIKEFQEKAPTEKEKIKETLNTETDENKLIEFKNDLAFFNYITDPNFNLRIPDMLIKDNMVINGTKNSVHLINKGIGHTESDIVAYFPNEKICFMGDLLFANLEDDWSPSQTGRFSCFNPKKLHETLKDLLEKDIETYIPGHGDISSKDVVQNNMDFIEKYYLNQ